MSLLILLGYNQNNITNKYYTRKTPLKKYIYKYVILNLFVLCLNRGRIESYFIVTFTSKLDLHVNVLEVRTEKRILEIIKTHLKDRTTIEKKELYKIIEKWYPDLKESAFRNKIQELRAMNVIFPVRRGLYTTEKKQIYNPIISDKLKRIITAIQREKISDNYCIWETSWINEFMIHQPMSNVIIVEVDPDILETAYYFLRDNIYKKTYLKPNETIMKRYVAEEQEAIILLPYTSRSPVSHNKKITTPQLEKILVDLFFNSKLFYWIRGKELINIFNEAHRKYYLNFSTLLSYARGRRADKKLKQFLMNKTDIPQVLFL